MIRQQHDDGVVEQVFRGEDAHHVPELAVNLADSLAVGVAVGFGHAGPRQAGPGIRPVRKRQVNREKRRARDVEVALEPPDELARPVGHGGRAIGVVRREERAADVRRDGEVNQRQVACIAQQEIRRRRPAA